MARPRSRRAHDAVVDAAFTLFSERGLDATSMDAIAEASGVSKATIYKHWSDKEALALEVLSCAHEADAALPDPDTGDLRADLLAVLGYEPPPAHAERRRRLMPHLMAHAARNPEFGRAWRTRALAPPRERLMRALRRAVDRGELPRDLDFEIAIALLLGAVMYGHMWKLADRRKPADVREAVVDAFLRSYRLATTPRGLLRARVPRGGRR